MVLQHSHIMHPNNLCLTRVNKLFYYVWVQTKHITLIFIKKKKNTHIYTYMTMDQIIANELADSE